MESGVLFMNLWNSSADKVLEFLALYTEKNV